MIVTLTIFATINYNNYHFTPQNKQRKPAASLVTRAAREMNRLIEETAGIIKEMGLETMKAEEMRRTLNIQFNLW